MRLKTDLTLSWLPSLGARPFLDEAGLRVQSGGVQNGAHNRNGISILVRLQHDAQKPLDEDLVNANALMKPGLLWRLRVRNRDAKTCCEDWLCKKI